MQTSEDHSFELNHTGSYHNSNTISNNKMAQFAICKF